MARILMIMMIMITLLGVFSSAQIPRSFLRMNNKMGSGITMNVHCRSSAGDLGPQVLGPDQTYLFRMRGESPIICDFDWIDSKGFNTTRFFDVYVQDRDMTMCRGVECCWNLKTEGPCYCGSNICLIWRVVRPQFKI